MKQHFPMRFGEVGHLFLYWEATSHYGDHSGERNLARYILQFTTNDVPWQFFPSPPLTSRLAMSTEKVANEKNETSSTESHSQGSSTEVDLYSLHELHAGRLIIDPACVVVPYICE